MVRLLSRSSFVSISCPGYRWWPHDITSCAIDLLLGEKPIMLICLCSLVFSSICAIFSSYKHFIWAALIVLKIFFPQVAKSNFDLGELTEGEFSASGFPKMLYGSVLPTPLVYTLYLYIFLITIYLSILRFACLTSFQLKYGNEENFMPTGGRWNMVNKVMPNF
jgi:hypothetical protein